MADSFLCFRDAKQQLESEITEKQKGLIRIHANPLQESSTEMDLLEREIESRCIAVKQLDAQTCDCCALKADAPGTLKVLIIKYQESLPLTQLVINKARVRVRCADCLNRDDSHQGIECAAATKEQIIQTIEMMPSSQWQDLMKFACWRVRGLGRASLGKTGDDLLQEAIATTLLGADNPKVGRRWYQNRIDFIGYLKGAMRGIAYGWKKKFNPLEPLLEADIIARDDEDDNVSPLEAAASKEPLADRYLIASEQVERVLKKFSNDQVETAVLRGKCDDVSPRQVMHEHGLTTRQYAAALRRIQSQKSVLIVDEYDQMRKLLSRWLKAMDYAVVTASAAADGLRLYRECGPFDAVIVSHSLDLNGVALAMDVREGNRSQNIIITTTHSAEEDVIRPSELARAPILLKPFLRMQLRTVLQSFPTTESERLPHCRRRQRRTTHARKPVVTLRKVRQTRIPTQP